MRSRGTGRPNYIMRIRNENGRSQYGEGKDSLALQARAGYSGAE